MDLDSPVLDTIDCTPNTKKQMMIRKRKASQLIERGLPSLCAPLLECRILFVEKIGRLLLNVQTGKVYCRFDRKYTDGTKPVALYGNTVSFFLFIR